MEHKIKLLLSTLLINVLSFISLIAFAQKKEPSNAPLKDLDAFVEQMRNTWNIPGCAIAVVQDGKVIHAKGYGMRDLEQNLPVTAETIFPIASNTKAFTTAGLAILVGEGKLDWDRPAKTYIPEFQLFDEYATQHITPRDMACHRSGVPRHDLVWYGAKFTRQELFTRMRYLEPNKPFRSLYQYNNHMFMALGVLIEKVSGQPWEDFIKTRLLNPLGMKNTIFSVDDLLQRPNFSWSYNYVNGKMEKMPFTSNVDAMGPTGGIKSNVLDLSNWVIMQLGKGKFSGNQIVPEKELAQTHTPQVVVAPMELKYEEYSYGNYGMGWAVNEYKDHLRVMHNGSIEGFRSQITLFPRKNIGIIMLTNTGVANYWFVNVISNYISDKLLNLPVTDWSTRLKIEQSEAKNLELKNASAPDTIKIANTQPSHSLTSFAGIYEHPAYGEFTVIFQNNALKGSFKIFDFDLLHYHYDTFQTKSANFDKQKVTFYTNAQGQIDKLGIILEMALGKEIVFVRKK
ncbi:serine hydrolase [Thermoflexibacter ruber]|nr:serine hydrolase [Thermoflexibacter ruber]